MTLKALLFSLATVPLATAETILGVYVLHRHGDRTPKTHKPVNLTALGADQVYESGKYYRNRYVSSDAEAKVLGLSSDIAVPSQLTIQAPIDSVLQISGQIFLQSLYPPVGESFAVQELANGTQVSFPLGGYQYVPVNTEAASNDHSENNEWLQAGSGCGNALVSSNAYFASEEYTGLFGETEGFYQSILPVIEGTFDADEANFKNGYTIWDLINVATIHNSSIPSEDLLTDPTMTQLKSLAHVHEWNLAYNASSPIRAIAGSVLAGHILTHLTHSLDSPSSSVAPRLGIEFGAYATFLSFFGLADLPTASSDFTGIVEYASSMAVELFVDADDVEERNWPGVEDVKVRFMFANGTASDGNALQQFPLFGKGKMELGWTEFVEGMEAFKVSGDEEWCGACGVSTGVCAAFGDGVTEEGRDGGSGGEGLSAPLAGVVGALVAMVVLGAAGGLAMVLGGLRVVKKGKKGEVKEVEA